MTAQSYFAHVRRNGLVFSSPVFLFAFLPATCLLVLASNRSIRIQNILLVGASLVFYAWGNPASLLLIVTSTVANYAFALMLEASADASARGDSQRRKAILAICVIFNLCLLGVFKYANFIVANLNLIPGVALPDPGIPLPIGISFFTFQALSYVLDVGAGKFKAQRSLSTLLLYISFFPQLIAGPIVRYGDIEGMLVKRNLNSRDAAYGLRRFIFGLAKKVLVANSVGIVADAVFGASGGSAASLGSAAGTAAASLGRAAGTAAAGAAAMMHPLTLPAAWLGALAYAIQIYFDFSGYSDMAIGLGMMFGFRFGENFNYPYSAIGLRDFWRRWHISLTSWFREYLYIPLGGNRRGRLREAVNKVAVFFVTGFWHGASWNFIVWGLYHGLFLTLETYGVVKPQKMPKIAARMYTLLVVVTGFVIFRAPTLAGAWKMLAAMVPGYRADNAALARPGHSTLSQLGQSALALISQSASARISQPVLARLGNSTLSQLGQFALAQLGQAASLVKPSMLPMFAVSMLAIFPIKPVIESRLPKLQILGFILTIPLFFLCAMYLSTGTYNPFIYYRF